LTLLSTPLSVRYSRLFDPSVPGANVIPDAALTPTLVRSILRMSALHRGLEDEALPAAHDQEVMGESGSNDVFRRR
jgi:hypothetical protein